MDARQLYGESDQRGEDLLAPPEWHALAACAGQDTEDFYPDRDDGPAAIGRDFDVCAGCPAREPCLAWALDHEEPGI